MSKDNPDFSFEDLLEQELIQEVDNIDLVPKINKITKIVQDKVAAPAPVMDKEIAEIRQDSATRDTKEETVDHVSSSFVPQVLPNEVPTLTVRCKLNAINIGRNT